MMGGVFMCGRYVIFTDREIEEVKEIIRDISNKYGEGSMATGEIYPTNRAPVYVAKKGRYGAELMSWGLPSFKGSGVIINARAETAMEKPIFKSALETRRCIIPSTGFFEWGEVKGEKKKIKYLFNLPDSHMLYMAGLYNQGPDEPRFAILTTAANRSMIEVHSRMPLILRKNEIENWLYNKESVMEFLHKTPPELVRQKV